MTGKQSWDAETKNYFNTLPKLLQESIMQSDVTIQSKQDLERCCKSILDL